MQKEETQLTKEAIEAANEWGNAQLDKVAKHLAENGIILEKVITKDSFQVVPIIIILKVLDNQRKRYWAIAGDIPTDFTLEENAKSPKEVLRYFSLNWQLRAENLRQSGTQDKVQLEFAQLLEMKAESMYQMSIKTEWPE